MMPSSLSPGLGDLPDDIIGKTSHRLDIGQNTPNSLSEELSALWSKRVSTNLTLVPNDARLAGLHNNKEAAAQDEKRIRDTLQTAKRMASRGKRCQRNRSIYKRCLVRRRDFEYSKYSRIINGSFRVVDDCRWSICIRHVWSGQAGFAGAQQEDAICVAKSQCTGCQNNDHQKCLKFGRKKIIKSLDFTPEMFSEISNRLRMLGLIGPDKSIVSVEDIKDALAPKKDSKAHSITLPNGCHNSKPSRSKRSRNKYIDRLQLIQLKETNRKGIFFCPLRQGQWPKEF